MFRYYCDSDSGLKSVSDKVRGKLGMSADVAADAMSVVEFLWLGQVPCILYVPCRCPVYSMYHACPVCIYHVPQCLVCPNVMCALYILYALYAVCALCALCAPCITLYVLYALYALVPHVPCIP